MHTPLTARFGTSVAICALPSPIVMLPAQASALPVAASASEQTRSDNGRSIGSPSRRPEGTKRGAVM
jgi:hypothetical protein